MAEAKNATKTTISSTEVLGIDPTYVSFLEGLYQRWIDNLFKLSESVSQVAQSQIRWDVEAWAKLATCRDPKELADCQRVLAEAMSTRFAENMAQFSELVATVAGTSYLPPRSDGGTASQA